MRINPWSITWWPNGECWSLRLDLTTDSYSYQTSFPCYDSFLFPLSILWVFYGMNILEILFLLLWNKKQFSWKKYAEFLTTPWLPFYIDEFPHSKPWDKLDLAQVEGHSLQTVMHSTHVNDCALWPIVVYGQEKKLVNQTVGQCEGGLVPTGESTRINDWEIGRREMPAFTWGDKKSLNDQS